MELPHFKGKCPVFEECIAHRIETDDRIKLDVALAVWDKNRWPFALMATLGKLILKYRKKNGTTH